MDASQSGQAPPRVRPGLKTPRMARAGEGTGDDSVNPQQPQLQPQPRPAHQKNTQREKQQEQPSHPTPDDESLQPTLPHTTPYALRLTPSPSAARLPAARLLSPPHTAPPRAMDDFNSDTDSDYTSYWRDWVRRPPSAVVQAHTRPVHFVAGERVLLRDRRGVPDRPLQSYWAEHRGSVLPICPRPRDRRLRLRLRR